MSRSRLDQALRDYYEQQNMPEQARRDLLNRIKRQTPRPYPLKWLSVAAVALVLLVAGSVALLQPGSDQRVAEAIATEVVANHLRDLPPDFAVSRFDVVARRMPKLDFAPARPDGLVPTGAELVGSRYCTIQGEIAVQYRLRMPDGDTLTLYQSRAREGWQTLNGQSRASAGIPVKFQVSDGLVSVLAGRVEHNAID